MYYYLSLIYSYEIMPFFGILILYSFLVIGSDFWYVSLLVGISFIQPVWICSLKKVCFPQTRGKQWSFIRILKLMMKVLSMGPRCQNFSWGRSCCLSLIHWPSSSHRCIHLLMSSVLSRCNSSLSGRERTISFDQFLVCVCMCVYTLREVQKKRYTFSFF